MRISKLLTLLFISVSAFAQAQERPKIVVGIIVDQMRQEYLYRFMDQFGQNGFKRLIDEGFMYKNMHYNYVPTITAPGHTSVYTGSTPAFHGIIGNNWFDQQLNETIYCAYDSMYTGVGSDNTNGRMSPRRLEVTTITDEVRMASEMRSRVIGLSMKDRGAIFPAGHTGQAYWYDSKTGAFITSNYYRESLPEWLIQFNQKKLADSYLKKTWSLLKPESNYTASDADESIYEGGLLGKTTLPYDLASSDNVSYGIIPATPFGNDLLAEAALAALKGEKLGEGNDMDFLCVSFSSTDYIGHNFGPYSRELEDCYLRLDQNIASLLSGLDKQLGKGNYLVFLTADHAVADVPQRSIDHHLPGGYMRADVFNGANQALSESLGEGNWIRSVSSMQVFLNRDTLASLGKDIEDARRTVAQFILEQEGIAEVYTFEDMIRTDYNAAGIAGALRRGFNQKRSGDVLYVLKPGWLQSRNNTGTSHGSPYNYDTHVPMLWMGHNIQHGISEEYHTITDIAPTLADILHVLAPSGTTGRPLPEISE